MNTKAVNIERGTIVGELVHEQLSNRLFVVCHGYQSSSRHPAIVGITQGLNSRGHSTYTFNFSDTGGIDLGQQVADINHIIDHFDTYEDIVLLAGSFGALSASIAARSTRVKGLVTINGFFGSDKLGLRYRATYIAARALSIISPNHRKIWKYFDQEYNPAAISASSLIIHAKHDGVVSDQQSREFFQRLSGSKKYASLEEADHHLTHKKYVEEVVQLVDIWIGQRH